MTGREKEILYRWNSNVNPYPLFPLIPFILGDLVIGRRMSVGNGKEKWRLISGRENVMRARSITRSCEGSRSEVESEIISENQADVIDIGFTFTFIEFHSTLLRIPEIK